MSWAQLNAYHLLVTTEFSNITQFYDSAGQIIPSLWKTTVRCVHWTPHISCAGPSKIRCQASFFLILGDIILIFLLCLSELSYHIYNFQELFKQNCICEIIRHHLWNVLSHRLYYQQILLSLIHIHKHSLMDSKKML